MYKHLLNQFFSFSFLQCYDHSSSENDDSFFHFHCFVNLSPLPPLLLYPLPFLLIFFHSSLLFLSFSLLFLHLLFFFFSLLSYFLFIFSFFAFSLSSFFLVCHFLPLPFPFSFLFSSHLPFFSSPFLFI